MVRRMEEPAECREGDLVMFVAFGGGLTCGASLWRM